jgi:hypothetical protein
MGYIEKSIYISMGAGIVTYIGIIVREKLSQFLYRIYMLKKCDIQNKE